MQLTVFRPPATQSQFIGQYATQVVTFPRLDHPPQRPLSTGNLSVSLPSTMISVLLVNHTSYGALTVLIKLFLLRTFCTSLSILCETLRLTEYPDRPYISLTGMLLA